MTIDIEDIIISNTILWLWYSVLLIVMTDRRANQLTIRYCVLLLLWNDYWLLLLCVYYSDHYWYWPLYSGSYWLTIDDDGIIAINDYSIWYVVREKRNLLKAIDDYYWWWWLFYYSIHGYLFSSSDIDREEIDDPSMYWKWPDDIV